MPKNNASGARDGGKRSGCPESSRKARDGPRRICEIAMENRILAADPNAR
jgi:hypothetical protein